jgi:multiple sugar transport system substrate-binding protein
MMLALPTHLSSAHESVAQDFIAYMISKEAQEMIMHGEYSPEHDPSYPFRLPVRSDLFESKAFESYQIFIPFITSYDFPSLDVPSPAWQAIKSELYTPELRKLILGDSTIDLFLDTMKNKGQNYMEESHD